MDFQHDSEPVLILGKRIGAIVMLKIWSIFDQYFWPINFDNFRYFCDTEISDIVDIEQDDQPSFP